MTNNTLSKFRRNRGRLLAEQINKVSEYLGRDIVILDVGGRPDYWLNIGLDHISRIDVLNYDEAEMDRPLPHNAPAGIFQYKLGDARELTDYADQSVDLIHANSVIEHVGNWRDMRAMANEVMRVGKSGWVQTPAWEFPIEPHFRAPFMHWFGRPLQTWMMSFSVMPEYRRLDIDGRRPHVDRINLLSKREMRALFPDKPLLVERVILAKSYTARWMPEGVPL
jgi:hypothetical protein